MLVSDSCYIDKSVNDIESYLADNYGPVIRWAIVEVAESWYKISFTYEK